MDATADFARVIQELKNVLEFDQSIFQDLRTDTDEMVALKILARFSLTLEESLAAIADGMRDGNSEIIWKALHKTAGSAELVGFKTFGRSVRDLSGQIKSAHDNNLDTQKVSVSVETGKQILAQVKSVFTNLKDYL